MQHVYTPLSFLKRFLIGQEKEVTVSELVDLLQGYQPYFHTFYKMSVEELVNTVLHREDSPFIVDGTDMIRSKMLSFPMNKYAYDCLSQTGKPQMFDRIVKQIAKKSKLSPIEIEKQLCLEKDIRFVQVEGLDRWLLTEWEICNDEIYRILEERNIEETNANYIYQLISTHIQKKDQPKQIWVPDVDPRFTNIDGGKVRIRDIQETKREATEMETNITINEQANQSQSTFHSVLKQIEQGLEMLQSRNQQMSDEVVGYFDNQDLEAIRRLMDEKKLNLEFQQDVANLIEKWRK